MGRYSINSIGYDAAGDDAICLLLRGIGFVFDGCGHQQVNCANNSCNNRVSMDFEIIYVIGGSDEICIDKKVYRGKAGDLFLIPPFVGHYIHTTKEDPHDNYWLHFDITSYEKQERFLQTILPGEREYLLPIGVDDRLVALFEDLRREAEEKQPGHTLMIGTLVEQIVTRIIRKTLNGKKEYLPGEEAKNDEKERIVRDAIAFMKRDLSCGLSTGEIAEHLHISQSYLFKCFGDVLAVSPQRFFNVMRAKKASLLLRTTDLRLSEISDQLGFSSYYYFSAFFKRRYGISPREYRNSGSSL